MSELIKTKLRRIGTSFGVIIPKETLLNRGIKEGQDISIIIPKKSNVLRETFKTSKFKKNISKILRESDKELYDF